MLIPEKNHFDIWNKDLTIPILALDIVIFTVYRGELCVLLSKIQDSGVEWLGLPWWIVAKGFSLEENFDNILKRKTWIEGVYKEQLYTFGDPWRDPKAHIIAVCYYALVAVDTFVNLVDFTRVDIVKFSEIKNIPLFYDYRDIINYAHQRLVWKMEYTNIAKEILPKKFKISELQKIYEIITWKEIDKRNFQKKIFSLDIIKETGEKDTSTNRPAKIYTFKDPELKIVDMI